MVSFKFQVYGGPGKYRGFSGFELCAIIYAAGMLTANLDVCANEWGAYTHSDTPKLGASSFKLHRHPSSPPGNLLTMSSYPLPSSFPCPHVSASPLHVHVHPPSAILHPTSNLPHLSLPGYSRLCMTRSRNDVLSSMLYVPLESNSFLEDSGWMES
ncbi:hypothetical protein CVT26_013112 [Gymnopilus dilepis]|uniref:Uncharacterized protein n=1 Tax=Gymnopilus dilepis TaxID=231916 RepID=A0A409YF91_9AGAR|nr:hypothetical protein CVT26_013112 [Gymnopilus dilepis]